MGRVALLICVAACGRIGFEPQRSDGLVDITPADCWPAWTTGPLSLSTPRPVSELASGASQGDPWLSQDGLTLYFTRGDPVKDLYVARRPERSAPWGGPVLVADLSSPQDDTKAAFTADGLLAIWSSNRPPAQSFDLWQATRASVADTFGAPSLTPFAALNNNLNQYDPHLSGDGLRLYLAPDVAADSQQVQLATRSTRADPFGPGAAVPLTESVTSDPTLSPDERVIVYSAPASGMPVQMYYATRSWSGEPFSVSQRVPVYDMPVRDQDPAFSYDGCELYFSSLRGGSLAQLYVTFVQ